MPGPSTLSPLLTRRRLLKLGLGFGGAVVVLGGLGAWTFRLRPTASGRRVLSTEEISFVDALAEALFPGGNPLGLDVKQLDVSTRLDENLARYPAREQRVLRAVLTLVEQWPRLSLSSASRFSELPLDDRVAVLTAFDESRRPERRGLMELLRIVVGMAIFEDPAALAAIGHRFGCPPIPQGGGG